MNTTLKASDFAALLGAADAPLPESCQRAIQERNFDYEVLTGPAREAVFVRVLQALEAPLEVAGPHRLPRWEQGWAENLREFMATGYQLEALVPKFVRRNEVVRLRGEYIQPADAQFETHFVTVLRQWLFWRWLRGVATVYEFGCGTGHNLVALARLFPDQQLHGLDWAQPTLDILKLLAEQHNIRVSGRLFDLNQPDGSLALEPGAGVFTIGTLEQLGVGFNPFLDYLRGQRPQVCIHVETLYELYDPNQLHDYVAARYLEKRGYLRGFLTRLRELETTGRVEIMAVQRTFGSLFHDGYSYVVWRPV